ncbi:MAG: alcohol dehydrogenase catalytic domain-containing protein [Mycobacterium sp.]|nr:alcohol dehydrogenase catalytic domain-containing protein [Mycobacterium sp.]
MVELGADVTGFEIGELVSVPPLIPCRTCDYCLKGAFGLCENYDYFGSRCDGAYAQYTVSPVGNLLKMPAGIDPRAAAMLDPAAIALHGLWKTGLRARPPGARRRSPARSDCSPCSGRGCTAPPRSSRRPQEGKKAAMARQAGCGAAGRGRGGPSAGWARFRHGWNPPGRRRPPTWPPT